MSAPKLLGIGIGAPGLAGEPSRTQTRPDRCATYDHPLVTFNPWLDETFCLCGLVRRPGNRVESPHMSCCGGPLSQPTASERSGKPSPVVGHNAPNTETGAGGG